MELKISDKTILRVLFIITIFVGIIYLSILVLPQIIWLLIAAFFALALEPAVSKLAKIMPFKSRFFALVIVFFSVLALFVFLGITLIPPLFSQIAQIVREFPVYLQKYLIGNNFIANFAREHFNISQLVSNQEAILKNATSAGGWLLGSLISILSSLAALLTILTFTFFMVLEAPKIMNFFWSIQPKNKLEHRKALFSDMSKTVTGYVNGNLLTSFIAAFATFLLLAILHLPYALTLGILVGIIDLIPMVGATLGAVIIIIIALVYAGPGKALIVLVFYILYQQLESNLLSPIVYSKSVKISPLVTGIAAVFGVVIAGFFGALVAIPVAASLQLLVKDYLENHKNDK